MDTMSPVLEHISEAAKELAEERTRLNLAYISLRQTVLALDPMLMLDDEGNIRHITEVMSEEEIGTPSETSELPTHPIVLQKLEQKMQEQIGHAVEELGTRFEGLFGQLIHTEAEASTALDRDKRAETIAVPPARQEVAEERPEPQPTSNEARIFQWFKENPGLISATELAKQLGVGSETVRRIFVKGAKDGRLRMVEREVHGGMQKLYQPAGEVTVRTETPQLDPDTLEKVKEEMLDFTRRNAGKRFLPREIASSITAPVNYVIEAGKQLYKEDKLSTGFMQDEGIMYVFPTQELSESSKTPEQQPEVSAEPSASSTGTPDEQDSSTQEPVTTPPSRPVNDDRGLSRSPKSRSEMKAPQVEAEKRLDALLLWLQDHEGPYLVPDITEDNPLGVKSDNMGALYKSMFSTLEERGFLRRLEERVWSKQLLRKKEQGITGGRKAWQYVLTQQQEEAKPSEEPEPVHETSAMVKVRDWFKKQKEGVIFSPGKVSDEVKLDRTVVLPILQGYAERGSLIDESPSADMPLYSYVKPRSAGKAAEEDAARRKAAAKQTQVGGAPVAGSGGGLKTGHHASQFLVDQVEKAGGRAEMTGGGHIALYYKSGRELIAHTPNSGGEIKDKAKVRRLLAS